MDAQQEFFTAFKVSMEARGYAVFDGVLPPKDTPYPFVYLGDFRQADKELKNAVTGIVYPTIHVWHNNIRQRGTVSKMLYDAKTACRRIIQTENFAWMVRNVNGEIISDNTTETPLLHGIVTAECLYS
jgi:hypothetical protein